MRTKRVAKKYINHDRRHKRSENWITVFHSWDRAVGTTLVIEFDKKFRTRPEQKVNYLNALSYPFDKVSYERDL